MGTSHMTTIIFSTIVIMLISPAIAAQNSGDIGGKPKPTAFVVKECKGASNYSRRYNEGYNYVTQEFCISTLQSDNRSADAKNHRDLALIPVDILKGRVVTAGGNVKEKLQSTKNITSSMARHLRICELSYDATASMLNLCGAFMRNYQGDNISEYNDGPQSADLPICVDEVNMVSGYCAYELLDMPGLEALAKENDELQKLINLSMALLSPYRDS